MRNRTRTFLPLAILLTLAAGTAAQQPVPPEVVEGWRNYTARFSYASGDYTSTSTVRQGQESSVQIDQVALAFTSRCKRVEVVAIEHGRAKTSKRLICSNPKYAFRLEMGEKGWLLREVVLVGDDPTKAMVPLQDQLDAWLASVHCLEAIHMTRLLELAEDLCWIEPQPGQSPALALSKERRMKEGPNTVTYHKLSLLLNDDQYHTLQSAKADILINKSAGTLEYSLTQQAVEGIPVPVRRVKREVYPAASGGMDITSEATFRIDPTVELPDENFTLTAYGLPEPVGVAWRKPTRNYVWFLATAAVFVALAIGFRLLARRRTATVSGEKPNAPPP